MQSTTSKEIAGTGFFNRTLDDVLQEPTKSALQDHLLNLARNAQENIPAYRHFLKKQGGLRTLQTLEDFRQLPLMSKSNYMQVYPLPDRCRNGSLQSLDRIAVSSGSTGTSTFWPRALSDELDIAVRFEQIWRDAFQGHEKSTLAIVCFALGNWVGGMFTSSCCWHLAEKGYPLMVATPGNKREEILRVVRELGPHFEQTVLLGYPPFVKDVIDGGLAEGINWPRYRVKTVFAGEVFSEEWRSNIANLTGSKTPCYDSASLYGTADGGVLGNETPYSIAARRFFAEHPEAARQLFGESRLPTLVQYDPQSRYFELHEGTLVVSGNNGVPLIRYHIADQGGLIDFTALQNFLKDWGASSLLPYGLDPNRPIRQLPFVWVFGRADFTVSYYGANVYPENITVGLEQPEVMHWLTGKFVVEAPTAPDGQHHLHIAVELLPNITADQEKTAQVAASIKTQLLRLNSEFANYTPTEKQTPKVTLLPFGQPDYFPVGVKHRYSRR